MDRDHLDSCLARVVSPFRQGLEECIGGSDVVIATHWLTADPVWDLPKSCGRKFYFIQGYEVHAFPQADIDATWRMPMQKIVVSSWLKDFAKTRFDDRNAKLVANGLDTSQFHAEEREVGRPATVGFAYSPVPMKGAALVREAVVLARRSLPQLGVVSFGATRPTKEEPLPPGARFFHRPRQEQLRDIYTLADMWLCASEREGFSLPTLEAMACRCPVVVTECGGPRDFVREGVSGFFVPVGDAEAMADRIVHLVSDAERWRRMSDAAYLVRETFSFERSAVAMERALMEVAGVDRPREPRGRCEDIAT